MTQLAVKDSTDAEEATRRHFKTLYGKKLHDIKFSKVWLHPGNAQDVWQVEGEVVLEATFKYAKKQFKIEIDNVSGEVIGFEENDFEW